MREDVRYLIFDVESIADGELVSKLRYPGQDLGPREAVARYRAELMEKFGNDFIPYTFHLPVSLVVAKVDAACRLVDVVALDEPQFRPHVITDHFWRGWEGYQRPTFVSFNGRTFDLPLMELAAFRFGISLPGWFNRKAPAYEQHRNRYNMQSHIDLQELLTNFGSTRFTGGLNLASNLLGKPGKMQVQGFMVQDMHDDGKAGEINDYCRCDVLDTYFVFLRSRVLLGELNLADEQQLVAQTKEWLESQAPGQPVYAMYLESWCDWQNPWDEGPAGPLSG